MLAPGQIVPLTIEKPAAGGRMIARSEGLVVLVLGAIPGERVRARVERLGKGVAYAHVVAIDEPSPDRRSGDGDPLCGGCLYAHISPPRQLEIKAQVITDAFVRIGRIDLPSAVAVQASPEEGYRMRARLHVRGHRLGFFREGTHDVCDSRQTRQLLTATCDVLDRVNAGLRSLAMDAVCEIELAENVDASDRVVYLDAASAIDPRALERLAATGGLTGLVSPSGAHGPAHVVDRLVVADSTVTFRRHVLAFFQGNRYLLQKFIAHVVEQVPIGSALLDLYAGAGLFSITAAAVKGASVVAIEGDRFAAADLAANVTASGIPLTTVHGSVESYVGGSFVGGLRASMGFGADPKRPVFGTIVVDPPRTGMSREALAGAISLRAPRVVYVSCDVATLARDARRLIDAGYAIARADAFDLFPNTPHVETVVVFERTSQ